MLKSSCMLHLLELEDNYIVSHASSKIHFVLIIVQKRHFVIEALEENIWEKPPTLNSTVKMATDVLFDSSSLNAHCQMLHCHCYILFLNCTTTAWLGRSLSFSSQVWMVKSCSYLFGTVQYLPIYVPVSVLPWPCLELDNTEKTAEAWGCIPPPLAQMGLFRPIKC